MKLALVHDCLCSMAGSERVFQYMCEAFPDADIYTVAYNPDSTFPYFDKLKVRTTLLNHFVRTHDAFRWLFPVATYVVEWLDLSAYDLVLTSSATVAKYVKVPNGKHVCYCYIPTRALWQFDEYFESSLKGRLVKPLLSYLQQRDFKAAQRVDEFIAISAITQDSIRKCYGRESKILHSPIDLNQFHSSSDRSDAYLIVSRLEQWKRVQYAIEAFNELELPLKVIGTGVEMPKLKAIAKGNISFLGSVDDETLAYEYSIAKAVIFTPCLEYGLIPLEASASGTPVIAYGRGGIEETMVPLKSGASGEATAIFFYEQTPEALIAAIGEFQAATFNRDFLQRHASKWGVPAFKKQLRASLAKFGYQDRSVE